MAYPCNTDEDQKRENKCEHVQKKLEYEDSLILETAKKVFGSDRNDKNFLDRIKEMSSTQEAYEFLGSFYFNQQDINKGIQYFFEGLATFTNPTFEQILKRMQSCIGLENQEQYQEEAMKKELKIIYEEIKQTYEKKKKGMEKEILEKTNELRR